MNKTPTQNKLIRFTIILSRIGKYLMLLAAAGFVILSVIGIYVLAFPALQVVLPVVMGLFYGETISVQLDPSTIFFGLVILALAQFFQYGASLEDDVDGLL